MKRCLRWHLRVLRSAWWLLLLLAALALLMGWEAAANLAAYARRVGELDPRSALAMALDLRHFFPLAGAVWAALWLGMDFDAAGASVPVSRGFSRFQVFGSKYLLFLAGCLAVSVLEQLFAVLSAVPGWGSLPAPFLLRCFALRLLLDLGMMSLPAVFPAWGRGNVYARLLGIAYGLLLWRLMGTHYGLWLPEMGLGPLWRALWPLAGLPVGLGGSALALRKAEL